MTTLQQAIINEQEALKMYEEGKRFHLLAKDKRNWRRSQSYWQFMDIYYSLGDYYNRDAQMYYKMSRNS